MRVLITTDAVGGVWSFTRELAAGMLAEQHDVCLVSFGREPSAAQCAEVASLHTGQRFAFHSAPVPLEWMENNESAYSAGTAFLLPLIDAWRPAVLHLNQLCYGALPCGLPKVVSVHSDVLSWAQACRPEGLAPSPWLEQYRSLVRSGVAGATALAAPTAWMRDAFLQHFCFAAPFAVVANSVSLQAKAQGIAARKPQLVTAGRFWDEGKGFALLTDLQLQWPIVVAGECPPQMQESEAVSFVGTLSPEELACLFHASAIYLCTSIYEPFGLAPLEAALCGCAVVARDLPSLREVWGDAALYFSSQEQLRVVVHLLTQHADLLHAVQQRCQKRAATFTQERMTRGYLDVYQQAMELHVA